MSDFGKYFLDRRDGRYNEYWVSIGKCFEQKEDSLKFYGTVGDDEENKSDYIIITVEPDECAESIYVTVSPRFPYGIYAEAGCPEVWDETIRDIMYESTGDFVKYFNGEEE